MRVRTAPAAYALVVSAVLASTGLASPARADAPPGWVVDKVRFEPTGQGGGAVTVEGQGAYRGAIEVAPDGGGLSVVDDVGLEDYVKGIAEVPPDWPAEALKAQAIAARTYALHEIGVSTDTSAPAAGASICATDSCQVYQGLAGEHRPNGANWVAAVDATAGQVLLSGDKPILAMYSSSNGGRSSPGSEPYLRSVNDPDDARSPLSRWRYGVPLATVAALYGVKPPMALVSVASGGGGVVLTLHGPTGPPTQQSVPVGDFMARIGGALKSPGGLPSAFPTSRFTVGTQGGQVVIDGRGWGHGIGMSQYGAYGKALRGLSAADILAAYYGGIRPTVLASNQMPATIRVSLASGQRAVAVAPERYFRVSAGSGAPLGGIEVGNWRVERAGAGVRVVPPEGRNKPLALKAPEVEPAKTRTEPAKVKFGLSAPAVVTVRYVTPSGQPGAVPAQVVDAGEVTQVLPPAGGGGNYQVVIEVDGGPGRFISVPLSFRVAGPSRVLVSVAGAAPPDHGPGRLPFVALAAILLGAVSLGVGEAKRRRALT